MEDKKYVINIAGKDVIFETGKYCMQSNGTCMVRCGDTVVMVNVTMSDAPKPGIDFFSLTVKILDDIFFKFKVA